MGSLPKRERLLAETVDGLRHDVDRLREAAWARSVVDVAKGVLIGRLGCGVDEAFDYLQELADTSGRGLLEVSASLLDLPGMVDAPPVIVSPLANPPLAGPTPAVPPLAGQASAGPGLAAPTGTGPAAGTGPLAPGSPGAGGPDVGVVAADGEQRRAARQAQVERLGHIGWAVWNLATGEAEWSTELYRFLDRDPALGPLGVDGHLDFVHAEDAAALRGATRALVADGRPFDLEYRIVVNGETRHLRAVTEAVRDGAGQPLEVYGFFQDVSALRKTRQRLELIRRELATHQHLLAEEHLLAKQLQQIILPVPDAPLRLPGMRVAVRYMPAERLTHVGGDWFQANALPDGALLLAVGDVAGHGLAAAATMAQLRHALAGLALLTPSPAAILTALNTLLCQRPDVDALLATAVVARYEPQHKRLTWAQAGHPPALVARTGGVRPLSRPSGLLLGVSTDSDYEQERATLEPGDLLLMFTDGLIEAAGVSLDAGLDALTAEVSRSLAEPSPDPLTSVIKRLRRANPADDTCILAAQTT